MSQNSEERKKTYKEQDKEITDLQKKYKVDTQEVLNAVIDSDKDLEKAEAYLKKRTEKAKWSLHIPGNPERGGNNSIERCFVCHFLLQ